MPLPQSFLTCAAGVGIIALVAAPAVYGSDAIIVTGFQTPESVVHDPIADVYLVSNVGPGNPGALDHNGFISRVSPAGFVVQLMWIRDGINGVTLNGPKGIWIHSDALYVADIDTLRTFDRVTGAPLQNIQIPNALFLNDVVVAENGTVYISDTARSVIFRVSDSGQVDELPAADGPNGVQVQGANVSWVAFFGNRIFRTNPSRKIFTVVDFSELGLTPNPLMLDGFIRLPDNSMLVSSWVTGTVYRISPSRKELTAIAQFAPAPNPDGPADINVDLVLNRLLVPLFNANKLVIVPLAP